jgi:hypothetical protein
MNEVLQEQIEDYVLGKLSLEKKTAIENLISSNKDVKKIHEDTLILKEALFRKSIRTNIESVRGEIKQKNKLKLSPILSAFAAAASVAIILLFTPIDFEVTDFKYRSEIESKIETDSLTNQFIHAQKDLKNNQNLRESIKIFEEISQNNIAVNEGYRLQAKWLLVNAYLKNKEPEKAEKALDSINCESECPYSTWEKFKANTQIFWMKL